MSISVTAIQAMDSMEAVAEVLRARFSNLTALEIASLSRAMVKAVISVIEK